MPASYFYSAGVFCVYGVPAYEDTFSKKTIISCPYNQGIYPTIDFFIPIFFVLRNIDNLFVTKL